MTKFDPLDGVIRLNITVAEFKRLFPNSKVTRVDANRTHKVRALWDPNLAIDIKWNAVEGDCVQSKLADDFEV